MLKRKKRKARPSADIGNLVEELRPMLERILVLQKQAKALGMFIEDRELLTCPDCGLQEDVTFDGRLQVKKPPYLGEDTGLRFKEIRGRTDYWRCPGCKKEIKYVEPPLPEAFK